jgi:cytochrome c peroxidase
MKRIPLYLALTAVLLLVLAACQSAEEPDPPAPPALSDEYSRDLLSAFRPLPEVALPSDYELTDEIIDLGRILYYEERISISQEMSCNTCHLLDQYGVDGLQFSLGHDGVPVGRNSPTVYNAALHFSQFWDGRAADVEEQAQGPILASGEMGMPDPDYVLFILNTIPGYEPLFAAAFPDDPAPINYDNVGRAIGAFERKLITPGRFDALLNGDDDALTDEEKRGLALFVNVGCTTCHYGEPVGGMRYAVMGQAEPYPGITDEGRFIITGNEADMHSFKVPSLLNIAETGPYLHDGSVDSLAEVVRIMARHQLARDLTDAQVNDIVAFLNSLTGEIPWDYITVPEFPPSGPDTPGPYEYEGS